MRWTTRWYGKSRSRARARRRSRGHRPDAFLGRQPPGARRALDRAGAGAPAHRRLRRDAAGSDREGRAARADRARRAALPPASLRLEASTKNPAGGGVRCGRRRTLDWDRLGVLDAVGGNRLRLLLPGPLFLPALGLAPC